MTRGLAAWSWDACVSSFDDAPVLQPAGNRRTAGVPSILSADLFGHSDIMISDRRAASLNVVVTGVMAGPGGAGIAMLIVDGRAEQPFSVGQEVSGGAVLNGVFPDHVALRAGGGLENIFLKNGILADPSASIRQIGKDRYVVPRALIDAQLSSPDLLAQANMTPAEAGGFRVNEIKPGSLLSGIGLRVGDVVRAVNGKSMNSMSDVLSMSQQLRTQGQLQIGVFRDGKMEHLDYHLR